MYTLQLHSTIFSFAYWFSNLGVVEVATVCISNTEKKKDCVRLAPLSINVSYILIAITLLTMHHFTRPNVMYTCPN